MTLSEAVACFEAAFDAVSSDDKAQFVKDLPVQWSGGEKAFGEPAWALYSTTKDAIDAWANAVYGLHGKSLKWIVRPELMEFQITIADKIGRHRAVSNRFAVRSQFTMEH